MTLSYREGASSVNNDGSNTSFNTTGGSNTLVNSSISQRRSSHHRSKAFYENFSTFEIFKRDLRINKAFRCTTTSTASSNKREIDKFSDSSRRSLRHVAANCFPDIKSQFLLTFHKATPTDGIAVKKHLNSFLTRLRAKLDCKYLWVMEFTRKGNPHIHLYLTCDTTSQIHQYLAITWNRICGETEEHLRVHLHNKNMIPWDMGSGAYVCKYLEKQYQKNVPDSFRSVGRFWGSSRMFVPPPIVESVEGINNKIEPQIDLNTGELPQKYFSLKFIYRTLRKYHESKVQYVNKALTGKKRKFHSGISKFTSSSIRNGATIYHQIMEYLQCIHPPLPF